MEKSVLRVEDFGLKYITELVQQHYREERGAVDDQVIARRTGTAAMLTAELSKHLLGRDLFDFTGLPFDEGWVLRTIINRDGHVLSRFDRARDLKILFTAPKGSFNRFTCFDLSVAEEQRLIVGDGEEKRIKYGNHKYCQNGNLVGGQFCDTRVYAHDPDEEEMAWRDWNQVVRGFHGKVAEGRPLVAQS